MFKNSIEDDFGEINLCILTTAFRVEEKNILEYWPPIKRLMLLGNFIQERVSEWPKIYGGVCPLNITYNYVPKYHPRKTNGNFGKIVGKCVVCNATHNFRLEENPFNEIIY